MKTALALCFAASLSAQAKPQSFFLLGADGMASTRPRPGGFAAVAVPVGGDTWSYSMYQSYFTAGKPVTSSTTGLAKRLWSLKLGTVTAHVVGLASVGAAQSGTSTTAAFNGGGGVKLDGLFKSGLFIWAGAIQDKTGSLNSTQVTFALGKGF